MDKKQRSHLVAIGAVVTVLLVTGSFVLLSPPLRGTLLSWTGIIDWFKIFAPVGTEYTDADVPDVGYCCDGRTSTNLESKRDQCGTDKPYRNYYFVTKNAAVGIDSYGKACAGYVYACGAEAPGTYQQGDPGLAAMPAAGRDPVTPLVKDGIGRTKAEMCGDQVRMMTP